MNDSSSYDWFTFYLRTTYVCVVVTLWCMDQPKQVYKLVTGKIDSNENFKIDQFFIKVHGLIIVSTILFFTINVRTNYIRHIVGVFEIILFGVLILSNFYIYYKNFIRRKPALIEDNEASGSQIQSQIDEDNDQKTIKILLWIFTLVTIGKMIVSPSYIFVNNPELIKNTPELYLFLDNINNELFLYMLTLILFSEIFSNKKFFPVGDVSFNSFEELFSNLKNTFKIYVLNVAFLTFIASKTKSNFLFLVYILFSTTSLLAAYFGRKRLNQESLSI